MFSEGERTKETALVFFNELQPTLKIEGTDLANPIHNELQIWIQIASKFRHFLLHPCLCSQGGSVLREFTLHHALIHTHTRFVLMLRLSP